MKFKKGNYKLLRSYAKKYETIYKQFSEILLNELQKDTKKNSTKKLKILDVGCFTGEFLEIMQKKGADVYGLELQKEAVAIANKKLPGRIFKNDIMNDEIPAQQFDVITLFGLIEHVTDPKKLLKKSFHHVKKGGIIMIQTPNSSSLLARILQKYWPPYAPIEHVHLFGEKSIYKALKDSGFTVTLFKPHWKKLPLGYVYEMLQNYGPEFHRIVKPFEPILKPFFQLSFRFYVGEMIVIARKK